MSGPDDIAADLRNAIETSEAPFAPPSDDELADDLAAPDDWSPDDRESFSRQPREVQDWALSRHQHIGEQLDQGRTDFATLKNRYDSIDRVLKPREEQFRLMGMQPAQYVDRLLALSDYANSNPAGLIQWLAKESGIDLVDLITGEDEGGWGGNSGATAGNRQFAPLLNEINSLKAELAQIRGTHQAARDTQAAQIIEQFRSAADAAGQPRYPHFDEVRALMGRLLDTEEAPDMETAYAMAVQATPTTRAKLEAARDAAAARKRQEEARKKAAAQARAPDRGVRAEMHEIFRASRAQRRERAR